MSRRRRNRGRDVHGILVLDKAAGLSSNAALQEIKRLFGARKAGHTGSLDPLATGVLPLCLGEATKVSQFLLESDKAYRATIRLGVRTDSGDREGTVIEEAGEVSVSEQELADALQKFEGEIEQLPPMYSALKVDGVPLYKIARKGQTIDRESRQVTVYKIELVNFDGVDLVVDIDCSKGTYIRALADDLGQILGCGAHVTELRRTQAGAFSEEDCVTREVLEEEQKRSGEQSLDRYLLPMDEAISDLPEVVLPSITASCVKNGQAVLVRHLPAEGLVRLYEEEEFIGIGCIDDDGKVAPRRLIVTH